MDDKTISETETQSVFTEYQSLRSEALKRVELQYQIFNLTLVFAGTTLTVGAGQSGMRAVLLIYPIMSMFFSMAFIFQTLMIARLNEYIRTDIEQKQSHLFQFGWSGSIKRKYKYIVPLEIASAYGLFMGTQVISILLYYNLVAEITGALRMLFAFSLTALFLTLLTLLYPAIFPEDKK